jgi:hypothetical protein
MTPGSHEPPNYWDAILWIARDLLTAKYQAIMDAEISVGDRVIVRPKNGNPPVAIGMVTEVNFAEPGGRTGTGYTVKVRDLRPNLSTQEQEYATESYLFHPIAE